MERGCGGRRARERLRFLIKAFGAAFLFSVGLCGRYQLAGSGGSDRFVRPAFSQRQKGVAVTLARGSILDRHGVPLHYPMWRSAVVSLSPKGGEPPEKVSRSATLSQIYETLAAAPENGLLVVPEEVRYGPGSLACHVVGHVRPNAYNDPRDNAGESGLEEVFQERLVKGASAWSGVVVTAEGHDLPGTDAMIAPPAQAPADLYTTLDAFVQKTIEEVLSERGVARGAVVVLDALTSEVLAMASVPKFDQNHPELSLASAGAPFVNRAISAFTPGSVFKPVVAALALDRGYVGVDEIFSCTGEILVGGRRVACGSGEGGHGRLTISEALKVSCNSVLIQIGLRIPASELVAFAKACGFGQPSGLPLGGEAAGVLPDPRSMYAGDIANACIGQGRLSTTPLQVAAFFAAIQAGGVYRQPSLVPAEGEVKSARLFSDSVATVIEEALVTAARAGTATQAWVPRFGSAGKTGTAETGVAPAATHAWFCGWTPIIAPRYVIAVFVEEGGDGPSAAAPVFREIGMRLLDTHATCTP